MRGKLDRRRQLYRRQKKIKTHRHTLRVIGSVRQKRLTRKGFGTTAKAAANTSPKGRVLTAKFAEKQKSSLCMQLDRSDELVWGLYTLWDYSSLTWNLSFLCFSSNMKFWKILYLLRHQLEIKSYHYQVKSIHLNQCSFATEPPHYRYRLSFL